MVWLYNQEIEPQLWSIYLPDRHRRVGVPVFLPAGINNLYGGATQAPYGVLFGRPAYAIEQCAGLGNPGDLIAFSPSGWIHCMKGTIQSAMSIHLKFDYDESVFRWIWRMDGQGAWKAPLTPYKTNLSKTYSYCAVLQSR